MNNLYDVLEICLQEIETGADVDTVLFRYPEYAEELRPILEASVKAKSIASPEPSTDVMRRNRARVLQHAAQMREAKVQPSRRLWSVPLRRMLVSLAVIAALFISSTGLVRAASTTLPGDNLYPVKRTWEGMRIFFTFDSMAREALEVEHENERLEELYELFARGRAAEVDFAGLVTRQNGDLWLVAKIPVIVSAQTDLHDGPVAVGDAVRVRGVSQADGTVLAERIDILDEGVALPEVDDDDEPEIEIDNSGNENENESIDDNSGKGSGDKTPVVKPTETRKPQSEPEKTTVEGKVDSVNGNIVVVNGEPMDISNAEIKGIPAPGAEVKVEGYYDENGVFIVTKIEFRSKNSGGDDGSNSNENDNGNDDRGSDDDGNDDSGNDNGNDDDDDDGGGGDNDDDGDNSGSGGGGGDDD